MYMSLKQNDEFYGARAEWLEEFNKAEKDLFSDERGEYIMVEPNLMDEGEGEDARSKKTYLPNSLQNRDQ